MKQIKQTKQQRRAWRTSSSLYLKLFMLLAVFGSSVGSAWAQLTASHFGKNLPINGITVDASSYSGYADNSVVCFEYTVNGASGYVGWGIGKIYSSNFDNGIAINVEKEGKHRLYKTIAELKSSTSDDLSSGIVYNTWGQGGDACTVTDKSVTIFEDGWRPADNGAWTASTNTYSWTDGSNNLMPLFKFEGGELANYTKLQFKTSNYSESYRVCFMQGTNVLAQIDFYSADSKDLDLTTRNETKDIDLSQVTSIQFGGRGASGSITLDPSSVKLIGPSHIAPSISINGSNVFEVYEDEAVTFRTNLIGEAGVKADWHLLDRETHTISDNWWIGQTANGELTFTPNIGLKFPNNSNDEWKNNGLKFEAGQEYPFSARAWQDCVDGAGAWNGNNRYEQSENVEFTLRVKARSTNPVVTFSSNNSSKGSVTATANGVSITSGAQVEPGTQVTFTATPTGSNIFWRWEIDGSEDYNSGLTKTVTINENYTIVGNFSDIYVRAYTNDANFGTVNIKHGSQNATEYHETPWPVGNYIFVATPKTGYVFKGWYDNSSHTGTPISAEKEYTLERAHDSDVTLWAYFVLPDPNVEWRLNTNPGQVYYSDGTPWTVQQINGSDAWYSDKIPNDKDFTAACSSDGKELAKYEGLLFDKGMAIRANGNLYMQTDAVLKIPVVAGEVVDVSFAKNGSGDRKINVANSNGSITQFTTTKNNATTHTIIAESDGFIVISNDGPSKLVQQITNIKKTLIYDYTFKDGDAVAATPGTSGYINEIKGLDKFPLLEGATYTWSSDNSKVVADPSTGALDISDDFSGTATITVTRAAYGNYPALTKSYTLSVFTGNALTHVNQVNHAKVMLGENGTVIFDVDAVWQDPSDDRVKDLDISYKVLETTAKEAKSTPDNEGYGTSEITIDGKGTTTVQASCGAISCIFYIDTYGFVFDETAPVFDFSKTTYSQIIDGATNYTMETIGAIDKWREAHTETFKMTNGTISGLPAYDDNYGGAIVVKAEGYADITSTSISCPTFEDGSDGWVLNMSGANDKWSNVAVQSNNALGNGTKFIEAWTAAAEGGHLNEGEIKQTITSLPAGEYTLEVYALAWNQSEPAKAATNTWFYVQEGSGTWTESTKVGGDPRTYTLTFTKTSDDTALTFGIATRDGDDLVYANWVAADNFKLSQYKTAAYVLTIPYKKYTWDFYNENMTNHVTEAQVLANQEKDGESIGYHLTMGDLVDGLNGHPHAASEVPSSDATYIPNDGNGVYPKQYVIDNPDARLVSLITKEIKWIHIQKGEESNVVTNNDAHKYWDLTFKTRDHLEKNPKKPVEYCNEELFSYKWPINGNNVRIVKDTQGLIFNAAANAFGINDRFVSEDVYVTQSDGTQKLTHTAITVREEDRSILIYKGTSFTIPFVKQGDYVKLHWYRHSTSKGDRFSVTNALDMDDKPIVETDQLVITGSHYQGENKENGVYRGYTIVRAKADGPITFTAQANSWMEIYTIELTDKYETELKVMCGDVTEDTGHPTDGWGGPMCSTTSATDMHENVIHIVRNSQNKDVHVLSSLSIKESINKDFDASGYCAKLPSNQFGDNPIIYIASYPGATYGWNGWTLDVECNPVDEDKNALSIGCKEALMTRIGDRISYGVYALTDFEGTGTAHVIVRTKNGTYSGKEGTFNTRYTLDKQEAYFPVGEYIPQTYPYTWDFRQYNINGTKPGTNGIQQRNHAASRTTSYGGWNGNNEMSTWASVAATIQPERNERKYNKFLFADGSQLTMNQSSDDGATYIREAEGLRVDLAGAWKKEVNTSEWYWNNNTAGTVTMDGNKLQLNGTITIPEVDKDMYVFVRSESAPTSVTINGVSVTETRTNSQQVSYYNDVATVSMASGDIPSNVWVYKQTEEGKHDVVITPASGKPIYAIGVTPYFKPMTIGFKSSDGQQLRSTWATDARKERIDYSNSGLFTNHNLKAYIAKEHSITNTGTGLMGTVKLYEKAVIPSSDSGNGLLVCDLLTDTEYNKSTIDAAAPVADMTARPLIPLFVPACNIPDDDISGNRLVGIVEANKTKIPLPDPANGIYNYILTNAYWTKKDAINYEQNNPGVVNSGTTVVSHISFYLLANNDGYARPNSAYLNLEGTGTAGAKAAQFYILVGGENDETALEEIKLDEKEAVQSGIYTLTGRKLDTLPTEKGIYIINGKKVFVK